MKKIIRPIFLLIILFLISYIYCFFYGNKYEISIPNYDNVTSVNTSYDENIIKVTNVSVNENNITFMINGLNKGKTYIELSDNNEAFNYIPVYVHTFNIITIDNYFGNSNGGILFILSIIITLCYILYLIIKKYIYEKNKCMYQYLNIYLLSLSIYLSFIILNSIISLFNYDGILNAINNIVSSCSSFSSILLPVFFIISILVTISNFKLMIKEGKKIKNMLGFILGLFLCFSTLIPMLLSDYLQSVTWIDVHNEQGIFLYLENFIDLMIYSFIAYLECLLICIIIYNIKVSLYKPKYDKDYIIILGCKIKNDGTLTNLLKARVDKAIEFRNKELLETNKDVIFIASGGKGNDEVISESKAISNYLKDNGYTNVIIEDKSTNTYENFKYSLSKIKEKDAKILFSTTNYHVFRSGNIAVNFNNNIEGIGSSTKIYFWVNAFIREYVAILYSEYKKHLFILLLIFIINLLMQIILYLSAIL